MFRKLIAEAFGTFCLVSAGTGAIVINDASSGSIGHVGIALTFGLVVMAMIYTVGDVSGAHLNPAVTWGFWIAGRFPGKQVVPFITAQCGGAILASALLWLAYPQHETLGATLPDVSPMVAVVFEAILTLVLMMTILSVTTGAKEQGVTAALAIGGVVALEAMFAGPATGASMNPARSLGPALLSGELGSMWIYLAGPMTGATAAFLLCRQTRNQQCCPGCYSRGQQQA